MDNPQELTHISLCSGYGGIDLGLKRALGAVRTIAYSEIESFVCANLVAKMEAGHLDVAPIWTNLKTFPWGHFRDRVDILSGGFPCQPFSAAGRRSGDEDPRHLWPHIVRGVRELGRPPIIFFENVDGIISSTLKGTEWSDPAGTSVLHHVLREMERMGYRATAGVFSASEVGAPHQRKRVFILGVRDSLDREALDGMSDLLAGRSERRALANSHNERCGEGDRVVHQEWGAVDGGGSGVSGGRHIQADDPSISGRGDKPKLTQVQRGLPTPSLSRSTLEEEGEWGLTRPELRGGGLCEGAGNQEVADPNSSRSASLRHGAEREWSSGSEDGGWDLSLGEPMGRGEDECGDSWGEVGDSKHDGLSASTHPRSVKETSDRGGESGEDFERKPSGAGVRLSMGCLKDAWPSGRGAGQYAWEPPRVTRRGQDVENSDDDGGQEGDIQELGEAMFSRTGASGISDGTGAGGEMGDTFTGGWDQTWLRDDGSMEGESGEEEGTGDQPTPPPEYRDAARCGESEPSDSGSTQSEMGGNPHGIADRLGYAELSVACDNRNDELRMLGNGVVPATAERAFRVLWKRMGNP